MNLSEAETILALMFIVALFGGVLGLLCFIDYWKNL